jgi:hypothetical protein
MMAGEQVSVDGGGLHVSSGRLHWMMSLLLA